jgi:hypothetical protein
MSMCVFVCVCFVWSVCDSDWQCVPSCVYVDKINMFVFKVCAGRRHFMESHTVHAMMPQYHLRGQCEWFEFAIELKEAKTHTHARFKNRSSHLKTNLKRAVPREKHAEQLQLVRQFIVRIE